MRFAKDLSTGDRAATRLIVRRLGRRSYADAMAVQGRVARDVLAGGPEQLLVVEHPPVVTLGRGTDAGQLLSTAAALAAAGVAVELTDRGGGATYHGPGQLVGYPIIHLRRRRLGVRTYLRALEAALVDVLAAGGVAAAARRQLTGVWTSAGKVAAIGIAVRRGVTRHGFALNVDNDLDGFRHIVPCGLHEPVTSLARLGWQGERSALPGALATALARRLGRLECATPRSAARRESTAAMVR